MTTRMSWRYLDFLLFSFAVIHILLFSVCPVSSNRIYQTKDAVVIEVNDLSGSHNLAVPSPSFRRLTRSTHNYQKQQQQQPSHLLSWWNPYLYKPVSSVLLNTGHRAIYSPEFKRSTESPACGVGPSIPMRTTTALDSAASERIFGGFNLTKSVWPFMVGLKQNSGAVFCGGSLISPTRILTAAHCVDRLSAYEISTMTVSLGMNNQFGANNSGSDEKLTRKVVRVVYHLEHNRKSKQNDVAVLTVHPPVIYSNAISPVCLPPASDVTDQFAGKDAFFMGWGLGERGSTANALRQIAITIITNSHCDGLGITNLAGFSITNQHICAGLPGISPCKGDDGGPMVIQTSPGSWTQVGINTFGMPCTVMPDPVNIYANVAWFRNWIDQYATDQYFITIPTIHHLTGQIGYTNPW